MAGAGRGAVWRSVVPADPRARCRRLVRGKGEGAGVGEPDELGESDARDLVAELVRANEAEGARPDGWTASAPWKTGRDIPDEVLFAAMEAVL